MGPLDALRFGKDPLALFRGLPSMQHPELAKQVSKLRRRRKWCDYWHLWDMEERLKKSFKAKQAEHLQAISKSWQELPLGPASEAELRFVDSTLAYVILPKLVFSHFEVVDAVCDLEAPPGGLILFDYACSQLNICPNLDDGVPLHASSFPSFASEPYHTYTIGFADVKSERFIPLPSPQNAEPKDEPLVYPPELSVILHHKKRGRHAYFVLSQSPKLGQVLRSVTKVGEELRIGLLGAIDDNKLWERIDELAKLESTWT